MDHFVSHLTVFEGVAGIASLRTGSELPSHYRLLTIIIGEEHYDTKEPSSGLPVLSSEAEVLIIINYAASHPGDLSRMCAV